MQFFIPMQPPTTTHNAKQLHAFMRGGKPCAVLHDSPELKATRAKLHAYSLSFCPCVPGFFNIPPRPNPAGYFIAERR